MDKQLFRKKSIERVSSPEQLNEYIRVSNPSVWIVLVAIMILLAGVCVWGYVGKLDTRLTTVAVSNNGETKLFIKEKDISTVREGMKVNIGDNECTVGNILSEPVAVDKSFSEYTLHVGSLKIGEWVYVADIDAEFSDGVYNASIVTESVSPISFVIN